MENQKVQTSRYYKYLISNENIYLAIYSMESYVFDYDLLSKKDKEMYQRLKDKFDERYICGEIIPKIRKTIEKLVLNEDVFIFTEVYFNPKKYEKGKMEYRPLHTTSLISQMAIVAMLNLFIYEVDDNEENSTRTLRLSNLSRLIPSNFYGNRVSLKPKELFKPWKVEYQKYTSLTNEYLKKYHISLEYKYEVTLDLQKFFPSVNPEFIRQYILEKLPVVLTENDKILYNIILEKLLYCKVENKLNPYLWENYYFDGVPEEKVENKDWRAFESFTKGIPQGLPQSYFLGNIAMIPLAEQFVAQFPGKSLFYVDDSVIFTNKLDENSFLESLRKLNSNIDTIISDVIRIKPSTLPTPIRELEDLYKVKVHENGKSYYIKLDQAGDGEIFLMCLSQEASQVTTDLFRLYSEEEDNILKERMMVLAAQIKEKIIELKVLLRKLEDEKNSDENISISQKNSAKNITLDEEIDRYKKFIDRLVRYYKFFSYRCMQMELMETDNLEELENIIYKDDDTQDLLEWFISAYRNNIWAAAVSLYRRRVVDKKKIKRLKDFILLINKKLFGYDNQDSSYLYKVHIDLFESNKAIEVLEISAYDSMKKMVIGRLANYRQKHYDVVEKYIQDTYMKSRDEIMSLILPNKLFDCMTIVNCNTEEIYRMVLNAIYSYLFSVEIEDCFVISKRNRKPLSYGELRILLFVRNPFFTEQEFRERNIQLKTYNNQLSVDYSVLEVVEAFHTFVKSPVPVDNLILTHQYVCEVWKNGSKYLYFYTLHNQEHAIDLIKNVIKLIHTFDYFKISSLDYYIIFLACYLHDIAMVKIPAFDSFLLDQEEADQITLDFEQSMLQKQMEGLYDFGELKGLLVQVYHKMDTFYENQIRKKHAANSAAEIRNVDDLRYLDPCLREFIAEVAAAHAYDTADIYFTKSEASNKKISMKFDKILLRLADALDISMYRISRPILYHNLEQMADEAAFHWISHLLIRGYQLETVYKVDKEKPLLNPRSIVETVILKVFVEMTQLSQCNIKEKCTFAGIDRTTLANDSKFIDLKCGIACSSYGACNFLCRWFTKKNKYLLRELEALTCYLERIPDNFFGSAIIVRVEMIDSTKLEANQFELIKKHIDEREE